MDTLVVMFHNWNLGFLFKAGVAAKRHKVGVDSRNGWERLILVLDGLYRMGWKNCTPVPYVKVV